MYVCLYRRTRLVKSMLRVSSHVRSRLAWLQLFWFQFHLVPSATMDNPHIPQIRRTQSFLCYNLTHNTTCPQKLARKVPPTKKHLYMDPIHLRCGLWIYITNLTFWVIVRIKFLNSRLFLNIELGCLNWITSTGKPSKWDAENIMNVPWQLLRDAHYHASTWEPK